MRKKNRSLVPFSTITAASAGNEEALRAVVKHYERYIIRLCTKYYVDKHGEEYSYIDEELRQKLEIALIVATMKFEIQ